MTDIRKLYKSRILEEAKAPYHFQKKEGEATRAYNPICGDRFDLYIGDETISFHGFGCTISKASTSFMIRELEGKSAAEARKIVTSFLSYLESEGPLPDLPALQVFQDLKLYKGRKDCIVLGWKAMDKYFSEST